MARTRRTANQPVIFKGEDFPTGVRQMSYNKRVTLGLTQHGICTDVKAGRLDDQATKGKGHTRAWWKRRATKQVRRHERAQITSHGE